MKLREGLHPLLTAERLEQLGSFQVERLAQLLTRPPEQLAAILGISFAKVRIKIRKNYRSLQSGNFLQFIFLRFLYLLSIPVLRRLPLFVY